MSYFWKGLSVGFRAKQQHNRGWCNGVTSPPRPTSSLLVSPGMARAGGEEREGRLPYYCWQTSAAWPAGGSGRAFSAVRKEGGRGVVNERELGARQSSVYIQSNNTQ